MHPLRLNLIFIHAQIDLLYIKLENIANLPEFNTIYQYLIQFTRV